MNAEGCRESSRAELSLADEDLHFVRTARFEPGASRLLARLRKYREEADYSHAFVVDADGACEELEAARAFVETVRGQMKAGADE